IDWNSFIGRVVNALQAEGKHQYLRDLSKDTARGMIENAKDGFLNGQRAPYGYDRVLIDNNGQFNRRLRDREPGVRPEGWKGKLAVSEDADKVALIRWLFDTYANTDVGQRTLADQLNAKRVPPPNGNNTVLADGKRGWTQGTIAAILRNPVYKGE